MERNQGWLAFKIELKEKYKNFALNIIKLVDILPKTTSARVIGNQLVKSGTSAYANYRAALRGRSKAEFYSKLSIVVEETDETEMWLNILIESGISDNEFTTNLYSESNELVKIVSHLRKTMSDK